MLFQNRVLSNKIIDPRRFLKNDLKFQIKEGIFNYIIYAAECNLYDQIPVVLILKIQGQRFIGLNFHWIPTYRDRLKILNFIYTYNKMKLKNLKKQGILRFELNEIPTLKVQEVLDEGSKKNILKIINMKFPFEIFKKRFLVKNDIKKCVRVYRKDRIKAGAILTPKQVQIMMNSKGAFHIS